MTDRECVRYREIIKSEREREMVMNSLKAVIKDQWGFFCFLIVYQLLSQMQQTDTHHGPP